MVVLRCICLGWPLMEVCIQMFDAQDLHHPIPCFCAVLHGLQEAPRLLLGDPLYRRPQLPSEHQSMVHLSPMLI